MGLNVAVFVAFHLLLDTAAGPWLGDQMVMDPRTVWLRPWTLLTAGISQFDANHLLFNLLGLWVFGGSVQRAYGGRSLVVLYVLGALCASVAHLLVSSAPMLGASGAVLALSVVFALTFPQQRLLVWFVLPVPAWLAVSAFVALDVVGMVGPGDGIAHAAHLGGAVLGAGWWWLTVGRLRKARRSDRWRDR
jgi:membrane associated rhomboid family serine protease